MASKQKIPTLLAEQTSDFFEGACKVIAWCPYCETYHMHGWDEEDRRKSHRVSHCKDTSPLKKTGYYLKFRPFKSAPKQITKNKRGTLVP